MTESWTHVLTAKAQYLQRYGHDPRQVQIAELIHDELGRRYKCRLCHLDLVLTTTDKVLCVCCSPEVWRDIHLGIGKPDYFGYCGHAMKLIRDALPREGQKTLFVAHSRKGGE